MGRRRGLTREIGHTGLQTKWGAIQDDFLREWRGQEKVERVDEMLKNSPAIGALRMAIELTIRDVQWMWTSESGENDPRLQLIEDALENMSHSWLDHVIDALLMPFYGWSMFTIQYERVGGRLLWRKFKELGHETVHQWLFDEDGGLKGLQQHPYLWPEPIPIERMVLYRFRKRRNNPEGESMLRPAWIPYYYAKNLAQIEAIGIERNLAGLPVIYPPQGAEMTDGSTDYDTAHEVVRNIRMDEQAGVVMPAPKGEGEHQRWRLELLSAAVASGSSKVQDTDMVVSRYEKRMLMTALAQFLFLGMDNIGALATFEGGMSFFNVAVNAVADIIAETFTKFAAGRLLELNGMPTDGIQLEHTAVGDTDVDALSNALQRVAPLLTWTADDEVALREMLRLPEKAPEEIEEEQQRRRALLPDRPDVPQNGQQPPQEQDEMAAVRYAAGTAPDDDDRRRLEGRMERAVGGVLSGIGEKVGGWAETMFPDRD